MREVVYEAIKANRRPWLALGQGRPNALWRLRLRLACPLASVSPSHPRLLGNYGVYEAAAAILPSSFTSHWISRWFWRRLIDWRRKSRSRQMDMKPTQAAK